MSSELLGSRYEQFDLYSLSYVAALFKEEKAARLDVLGYDGALDTYYEIEIMLGECDADHGFRALDYWARDQ